jgi:hypothetical protein
VIMVYNRYVNCDTIPHESYTDVLQILWPGGLVCVFVAANVKVEIFIFSEVLVFDDGWNISHPKTNHVTKCVAEA